MNHRIEYEKWSFSPDKIKSGNLYLAASLLASSLEVNSLTAEVECDDPAILDFARNTPLYYYAKPEEPMIFRVQDIRRTAPSLYEISATSTLGLLTEGQHLGGIYTGQTALEVIGSICGTVPFAVKHNLEGIQLYGWLPIATPRDNLAQVLFAIGAALKTDLDGVLRIEGLWDGISGTVTRDDMYVESAVDYDARITQVIVTEHQYVPWTEEKQLFEGTAQEGDVITFDDPMHGLSAEGFSILDSGANWAKVSAGSGVLTGKTYLHNTRQVTKDVFSAQEPNIKTVKDATLVSLVNSQACAQRLADYYRCRERVDAPVVYHGEKPGDRLATWHPFDKTGVAACLESADITLSNTLKAQEKSLVGFVPKQIEQMVTYDHRELLTESGTWTVPEGVKSIRIIVIGGGKDGMPGESGGSAITTSITKSSVKSITSGSSQPGKGGAGGAGGAGGNVYDATIEVLPGQVILYTIGEANNESIFGTVNSGSGGSLPTGWTDVITGETFATPGEPGSRGGNGGSSGSSGESINGHSGGAPSSTSGSFNAAKNSGGYVYNVGSYSGRSGGGGASNIGSGKRGIDSSGFAYASSDGTVISEFRITTSSSSGTGNGANGGKGKDATFYGCGGNGGHGGGGAGGYGPCTATLNSGSSTGKTFGTWSYGGSGGAGGAGAPGCIILYYGVEKKLTTGQLVDKTDRMVLDRLGRRIIM